jgi:hypothetical protein
MRILLLDLPILLCAFALMVGGEVVEWIKGE